MDGPVTNNLCPFSLHVPTVLLLHSLIKIHCPLTLFHKCPLALFPQWQFIHFYFCSQILVIHVEKGPHATVFLIGPTFW